MSEKNMKEAQSSLRSDEMLGAVFVPNGDYPYMPYREGSITIISQVDPKRWRFRASDGRENVAHLDWLTRYWKREAV